MRAIEGASPELPTLAELPDFELSCLFDSEDDPTEVTVFPETDDYDISTNWITVNVGAAIPLDQLR